MAETETLPGRATASFSRLTPLQKVALGAAVLTAAAGTFVLMRSSGNADMATLYTDLEARDAASVTDALMARNVDYELADGGQTVLVPRDEVYDLRISLSGEGLPASNEGYALLDEQGITTSEFRQRIDYQRALEGELSRTLRSIDGIDAATVHLALPEDSIFIDEPERATASVLVRSDGSGAITTDQVAAMVHLVAASVKGMAPEDVTIADAAGTVLTDTGSAAGGAASKGQVTTDFENDLASSLRTMVGRVAGVGNVAVNVRARLDTTQRQQTSEKFDSTEEEGVIIREQTGSEQYSGIDPAGDAGVLGPDGAILADPAAEGGEKSYSKDDADRTFAVNRTVEQVVYTPGRVERLNVAVLVDENAVSEAEVSSITEMVTTAAGIDSDRGDQITVTRLAFDTAAIDAAEEAATETAAAEAAAQQTSMIRTAIIAFVVLIALLLAFLSARRARREVSTPIDIGAISQAPIRQPDDEFAELEAGPAAETDPDAALEELSALAERRPEDVAQILQTWLADEVEA